MMRPTHGQRPTAALIAGTAALLALTAVGCGSGASSSHTAATAPPVTTATQAAPAPARGERLQIISPRRGAHTAASLTARVRLTGGSARGAAYRYVVDRSRPRRGPSHLTLRGLSAGRHHLVVTLASDPAVRASTEFIVSPPAPRTSVQTTQTSAQTAVSSSVTAPAQTTAAPPPVITTTHTTSVASSTHTASSGGIPQGGGGDADADNSGGPSDGDGSV